MANRAPLHDPSVLAGAALAALLLLSPLAAHASRAAVGVSPGSPERAVAIAGRCPTFSWAPVPGATGHELVLFELSEAAGDEPRLVLYRELPATASWTPPLAEALAPGRGYAWSVRGVGPEESEWSAPLRFTVALAPSEEEIRAALDVLQRAVAELPSSAAAVASEAAPGGAPPRGGRDAARSPGHASARAPAPLPALSPATAISAIRGEIPGTSGELVGVTGVSASADGAGLFGVNQSTASAGIGVWGTTSAIAGRGVYGEATGTSGASAGVYGTSASSQGIGAMGATSATSGATSGLVGLSLSLDGQGVLGSAPRRGVYGTASDAAYGYGVEGWYTGGGSTGAGVYGHATGAVGAAAGVRGDTGSDSGAGVLGEAMASCCVNQGVYGRTGSASGIGVLGRAISLWGGIGVQGISDSSDGIGVKGDGSGVGVSGSSQSKTGVVGESVYGTGVYGYSSESPFYYGVLGESVANIGVRGTGPEGGVDGESAGGPGVQGRSTAGAGVVGSSTNGPGVSGTSSNEDGLYGVSNAAGKSGVFATNTHPDGWAAYFTGRVHVNGTLSKLAGAFTIDHPLEPLTKTLSHSFVESPDMKNLYDGVVTLDAAGEAWVELPDWFEALNGELRYQLTPIGAWSPAWIGEPVREHRFLVRGDPGAVVSWQVTGVRQDVWARRHRIPVEADKPPGERGSSLHPAEWEGLQEGEAANPGIGEGRAGD